METINDVLCFLNELDFFDQINNDLIEEFRLVKRQLVIDFTMYPD